MCGQMRTFTIDLVLTPHSLVHVHCLTRTKKVNKCRETIFKHKLCLKRVFMYVVLW